MLNQIALQIMNENDMIYKVVAKGIHISSKNT